MKPPAEADIVSIEAQSFGVPLGYGGPYCGVIATRDKFVRQMPGRLAGETRDRNGKRGFVLTLSTREQHIRREKATSNICTNQALVALMVNIFMTVYGKQGLKELAQHNLAKAHYAAEQFKKKGAKLPFDGTPYFNEFVVQTKGDPYQLNDKLLCQQQMIGGFPLKKFYPELGNSALWCCTETITRESIDAAVKEGGVMPFNDKITKATTHINQNEGLIFEKSSPGKKAYKLPPLDVPEVDAEALLGKQAREDLGNMPEVSEIEIIRHFTRMSTWNYAIDYGMYPLGSCTMKYNARVNELAARLPGLANAHPYQPERISQGALRIMKMLSEQLIEITGMDAITLQPAAGAHGEFTGILLWSALIWSRAGQSAQENSGARLGAPGRTLQLPPSLATRWKT